MTREEAAQHYRKRAARFRELSAAARDLRTSELYGILAAEFDKRAAELEYRDSVSRDVAG